MALRFLLLLALVLLGVSRREIPEYNINLDSNPEDRFLQVVPYCNATAWEFYQKYFENDPKLTQILYDIVAKRGDETPELQGEIKGLANAVGIPEPFIQAMQMLYELQTLMVPGENATWFPMPEGLEALARIPWRGPGCTGIIATNKDDGTVTHARNLDFSPVDIFNKMVYVAKFQKGGKEIFRAQMVCGYQQVITGMKMGADGFAVERNTRYPSHPGGNNEMFTNLYSGRILNGWTLRKILENEDTFDAAIDAIATTHFCSTEYAIVSGVKKGVILSKDPESVAHRQTLGQVNFDEPEEYIIMTNFDFFFHDFREYFDPTNHMIGHPRRIFAQKLLNASLDSLTPEVLYDTINAKGVIADTIFQAIMNVENGVWNVSIPDL